MCLRALIVFVVSWSLSPDVGGAGQDPTYLIAKPVDEAAPRSSDAPIEGVSDEERAFFFAGTLVTGIEPWVTDGTEQGTRLLYDVVPGGDGVASYGNTDQLHGAVAAGRFVFRTAEGDVWVVDEAADFAVPVDLNGEPAISEIGVVRDLALVMTQGGEAPALWAIDPGMGTALILHRFELSGRSRISLPSQYAQFTELDGVSYFSADEDGTGFEVWKTDGTVAGTTRLTDLVPGAGSTNPVFLGRSADRVFFLGSGALQAGLWTVDGNVPRFVMGFLVDPALASAFFAEGGVFLVGSNVFTGESTVVFADGSPGGSVEVARFRRPLNRDSHEGVAIGDTLYIVADDLQTGEEIWAIEAPGGDTRILDLNRGRGDAEAHELTDWHGRLAFLAPDRDRSRNIWAVETGEDPRVVTGVGLEDPWYVNLDRPVNLLPLGDLLLYSGNHAETGVELFGTDLSGAEAGTVANIAEDARTVVPSRFATAGERVFFSADGVWTSDGTVDGTFQIEGPERSPFKFSWIGLDVPVGVALGDRLLFQSTTMGSNFDTLWVSDGSPEGTFSLLDVDSLIDGLFEHDGLGYFISWPRDGASELWVSDGTITGTTQIATIDRRVDRLASAGRRVLSYAELVQTHGILFGTDPVTGQTEELARFPRRGAIVPRWFVRLGEKAVFGGSDREHGDELWLTDGTPEGTRLAVDVNPSLILSDGDLVGASSSPHEIVSLGDRVMFFADDGLHGFELWSSDMTPEGTWMVRDIVPGPGSPLEVFPPGAFPVLVARTSMTATDGRVFFVVDDGAHGLEPWTSDGSEEGTFLLRDIVPGPRGSNPTSFSVVDGVLLFSACDDLGCELWTSDGSEAGTARLADILPGRLSSSPSASVAAGDTVFFGALDGSGGYLRGLPRETLPSPVPTVPRPTPTRRPSPVCHGDCDGNGFVRISELVRGVAILLGNQPLTACEAFDRDGDGRVAVNELVSAVIDALDRCA